MNALIMTEMALNEWHTHRNSLFKKSPDAIIRVNNKINMVRVCGFIKYYMCIISNDALTAIVYQMEIRFGCLFREILTTGMEFMRD